MEINGLRKCTVVNQFKNISKTKSQSLLSQTNSVVENSNEQMLGIINQAKL